MSQLFTADDLLQIKEVIMEELDLMKLNNSSDDADALLSGFAAKRSDFSILEEQLIRRIITNDVNGKLPSEQLRERIVRNISMSNNTAVESTVKRNSTGMVLLEPNPNEPGILTVDSGTTRYKKAKIRYIFDVNFSEFVVEVNNTDELIEQLKEQIESLRNKSALLDTDKANFKDTIRVLEVDNVTLKNEIVALESSIQELSSNVASLEQSKQEEIQTVTQEAQTLVVDANAKIAQKEAEFVEFKSKVEMVFISSNTYEEIITNFKKIGIGA